MGTPKPSLYFRVTVEGIPEISVADFQELSGSSMDAEGYQKQGNIFLKRALQSTDTAWEKWILDCLDPSSGYIFRNISIDLISDIEKETKANWQFTGVIPVKCITDKDTQEISCLELMCHSMVRTK